MVYYQPKAAFSWSDDDEDDTFDLETFRASTTDMTPTLEELGPLMKPLSAADDHIAPPTRSVPDFIAEIEPDEAPEAAAEATTTAEDTAIDNTKLPGSASQYLSADAADWPCQPPLASTFAYYATGECGVEAYPGLGRGLSGVRYNYAAAFRYQKLICGGFNLRHGRTFMLVPSSLSMEMKVEEEKVPEEAACDGECDLHNVPFKDPRDPRTWEQEFDKFLEANGAEMAGEEETPESWEDAMSEDEMAGEEEVPELTEETSSDEGSDKDGDRPLTPEDILHTTEAPKENSEENDYITIMDDTTSQDTDITSIEEECPIVLDTASLSPPPQAPPPSEVR
jgi:hypothetical protein